MGAQAAGGVHRSRGGHYDVYQGGQSFDDVIQAELEFLHRQAKKRFLVPYFLTFS
jgi:hypothetical protein